MKCIVCRQEKAHQEPGWVTFKLRPEEAVFMRAQTGENVKEWFVCGPCYRVLSDPIQGAQLIKGTLQVSMSTRGIENADQVATKFYTGLAKLVAEARKKQ